MLFELSDVKSTQEKPAETFGLVGANANSYTFMEGSSKKELQTFEKQLPDYQIISYYTDGAFSTHEVIKTIANYLGECELVISTWSISENSVRTLENLKKMGVVKKLSMLIDFRVPHHTPAAWQYVQKVADHVVLGNCHAKCAIFEKNNEHWYLQTSSNLSQNNRKEVGTLFKINELGLFHKNWILENGENRRIA